MDNVAVVMSDVKTIGKYQVRQVLGRGGMGVVYQAYDPDMDRLVAIKTLHANLLVEDGADNLVSRFRGEARAYGRLMHPNIVTCYAYEEAGDFRYIVLEYVRGRSLKEMFDERRRFSMAEAAEIMRQLLAALSYSHRNGVVHRDIKPANLLIMDDGQVKVTDFGIARIDTSHLTQTGNIIGSPSYMSPEQFTGVNVDHRTDIFSAGVVFYQLLTGQRPFEGGDLITAYHAVTSSEPKKPSSLVSGLPADIDALVSKALEKKPEDRYAGADEFLAAIDRVLPTREHGTRQARLDDAGTVLETAVTPAATMSVAAPAVSVPASRRTLLLAGGGAITVILLAILTWWLASSDDTPTPGAAAPESAPVDRAALSELADQTRVARIEQMLHQYECASLWTTKDAAGATQVMGYVSREQDVAHLKQSLAMDAQLADVGVSVQTYIWPYCELLQVLSSNVRNINGTPGGVSVLPAGESFNFREGQDLVLNVQTAAYDSYVYVDYYPQDGSVVHLYPNAVKPDNSFTAATRFVIGDTAQGGQKWTISPPFGREMIVAISAKTPLFPAAQVSDSEQAADYLQRIKTGIKGLPAGDVSADYIFITTEKAP